MKAWSRHFRPWIRLLTWIRPPLGWCRHPGGPRDGWTLTGRRTDRNSPCVLQDFVPFGAGALLPLALHNKPLSRARESLTTSCPGQPVHFFFLHFPSRFFFTAPAQSSATNAVVYAVLPTAPALHFTAPAQPPQLMLVCVSGLVFQ